MPSSSEVQSPRHKALAVTRRHGEAEIQLVVVVVFPSEGGGYHCLDGAELAAAFHSEGDAVQAAMSAMGGQPVRHIRVEDLP